MRICLKLKKYGCNGSKINLSLLVGLFVGVLSLGGCTNKTFVIKSYPEGALVMKHHEKTLEKSLYKEYCDKTPREKKLMFIGDDAFYCFTVEKRGYKPLTKCVTEKSEPTLSFDLEKIGNVPEKTFKKDDLLSGNFLLLPANIKVIIHSGVGNLDEKTHSVGRSEQVTEQFSTELTKACNNGNGQIKPLHLNDSLGEDWENISGELTDYVTNLDARRLDYYSQPPCISNKVKKFKAFSDKLKEQVAGNHSYLVYIWGKCVTETAGRQVGNVMLSILGAAADGAHIAQTGRSLHYDPSAFNPSSGTLIVLYVIDAKTSEVLHIEQRAFSDITNVDSLKKVVEVVKKFPNIDKK